jgi:hypothetical protein
MKFAGVNIYGHPNISCEDQHRVTTKKLFYLELKRNRQFHRLSAEQITIRLSAPPMTNGNNYENTFALKLFVFESWQTAVKSQGKAITSSAVCHDSKTKKIDSTKFL